jgi:hypothetical protein
MKFKRGDFIIRKSTRILYQVLSTKNHYTFKRITPTSLGRIGDFIMRTQISAHITIEKEFRKPTKRERAELL